MVCMQYLELKIADINNIFLIEDCAEAIGSKINNCQVGNDGHISTFSFYGNKPLPGEEEWLLLTMMI